MAEISVRLGLGRARCINTAFGRIAQHVQRTYYETWQIRLQVQCKCMAKRSFTTRIDEGVLSLAQRMAEADRRSVTSVIEIAVIEYAERKGHKAPELKEIGAQRN